MKKGESRKTSKSTNKISSKKIVSKVKLSTAGKKSVKQVANTPSNFLNVNHRKFNYIKTYVPGFDELIDDGIPAGNAILIEGGPGSGKTVFGLEVVKRACMKGKKVLFMSFEEPEDRLRAHMEAFGSNAENFEKQGFLKIKRFNALDIARSVEALLSEAKKELLIDVQPVLIPEGFDPDIVIIDSLSSIASSFSGEDSRFRIYMEQLFRYLEKHNMTSFLIREVSNPTHTGNTFVEKGEAVSFLSDGIISIYNVFYKGGKRKRAIEVIKMRGSGIDRRIVEFDIKKGKGAICYPNRVLKGDFILT
ncbi:MAG: AAA family ATPase [Nanoarchaeota archaeon]|jgi:circadian clock protein KaiC|nr:AAA family ATPase [Nanoarchaeota archaeon]